MRARDARQNVNTCLPNVGSELQAPGGGPDRTPSSGFLIFAGLADTVSVSPRSSARQ
jgi:hypothetical protein